MKKFLLNIQLPICVCQRYYTQLSTLNNTLLFSTLLDVMLSVFGTSFWTQQMPFIAFYAFMIN